MTGLKTGFQAEVWQTSLHMNFAFCVIDREALASRDREPELFSVLEELVKIMNFIKTCPLNTRLFAVLCEEVQAQVATFCIWW